MRPANYDHLRLSSAFSDKTIPDIDFRDEAVVQCDVPVVNIL